jgi:hypothetical protein
MIKSIIFFILNDNKHCTAKIKYFKKLIDNKDLLNIRKYD